MEIIKIDVNDLVATPELKEAVAKIGFDEYEKRFNCVYNDADMQTRFKNMLSEQLAEVMNDWKVVVINGELLREHKEEMCLGNFPQQPIFTNCVNGEPYVYIDMSIIEEIPEDVREFSVDYMLIKEGVHREQIVRGDMVIFDGTITWKGITYTAEQIHDMANTKTMELLEEDADGNQMDENDIMLLVDCQHEWEREATVRTLAGLSHAYEMSLSDTQRKLVDDWVKEMVDEVNARIGTDGKTIESPILNFETGSVADEIKDWMDVMFMCKTREM